MPTNCARIQGADSAHFLMRHAPSESILEVASFSGEMGGCITFTELCERLSGAMRAQPAVQHLHSKSLATHEMATRPQCTFCSVLVVGVFGSESSPSSMLLPLQA